MASPRRVRDCRIWATDYFATRVRGEKRARRIGFRYMHNLGFGRGEYNGGLLVVIVILYARLKLGLTVEAEFSFPPFPRPFLSNSIGHVK